MKLFNKVFKREKKEKQKEIREDNAFAIDPFEELDQYNGPRVGCSYCNGKIEEWHKRTIKGKDKYHSKCYRKFKKQVRKMI